MACLACGFEGVAEGKSCAVCGAETVRRSIEPDSAPTVLQETPRSARNSQALPRGTLFGNHYRIEELVGRGGMGTVYRVIDTRSGETRALKVLHTTIHDEEAVARFKREISTLSKVRHETIPTIEEWGVADEKLFFVGEFIDGDNLRVVQRRRGILPPDETARIGATIARALHAAHTAGVVHRDVKPHNIMVMPDSRLKLLDFGIARGIGIEMEAVTGTGMMIGTPEYMSPEQFGALRVDGRSDIYSLGVVLYELLTGEVPFHADTPVALAIKHQTDPPPPIRALRPSIPAWLERAILKCLEKDPLSRFLRADELADELERPRGGERRRRALPNGDEVLQDDSEQERWALSLATLQERPDWALGMALHFEGRYFRLSDMARVRGPRGERWLYRFDHWPPEQIFRKVVDYQEDAASREKTGFGKKLKSWLS